MDTKNYPEELPKQRQQQPGRESEMNPQPVADRDGRSCNRLSDRAAIITGGDSGIGRAVALDFAKEGADLAILYLSEHEDAQKTKAMIEEIGRRCILMSGDVGDEEFCRKSVGNAVKELGKLDILVNNAAEQHIEADLEKISAEQLERTFRTNIFAYFFMAKAALQHLRPGSVIINTASVTAYGGNPRLLDYSSTKGAIVSFTRSLSQALAKKGIRVNGVAPGPIWTPLIPATFPEEMVEKFGKDVPLERPGQPEEVAPCYVFLASDDSSYMTGQILHPNGGKIING
jgi:NAD(P)-dependent dehydrogenase (short-subunit alcohol dehydrogenase family)